MATETMTRERITPAKAKKMLEGNTANRPVRQWQVDEFARAMREGRWQFTHQGIAFNCDGTLMDGQHRLLAIIQSGKTIEFYVARGVARPAAVAIDQGITRTIRDIGGSPVGIDAQVTKPEVATARAMKRSISGTSFAISRMRISTGEMLAYILKHREAIDWAISHLTNQRTRIAPVAAAVARAYYSADPDRLEEFCVCLNTGIASRPEDEAAVTLSRFLFRDKESSRSATGAVSIYRKTESALRSFLRRKPMSKVYEVEAEIFPLLDDER